MNVLSRCACGHQPDLLDFTCQREGWHVKCPNCGAQTSYYSQREVECSREVRKQWQEETGDPQEYIEDAEEQAIAAWNQTRAMDIGTNRLQWVRNILMDHAQPHLAVHPTLLAALAIMGAGVALKYIDETVGLPELFVPPAKEVNNECTDQ